MRGMRPCGACAALVPELTGCRHWKPMLSKSASEVLERIRRERAAVTQRARRERQQAELARVRLLRAMGRGLVT